jgi:uncharacterized protein YycO
VKGPRLIVRFINSRDLVGRAIDFVEGGAGLVDHVEFGTPQGTWIGAHSDGGVKERAADYCKPSLELRYEVPVTQEQYDAVMTFARAQIGKAYDFSDIRGILFHATSHDTAKWICSELVCASCEAGGLFPLNVLPGFTYRVTPEMLHLSPLLIGRLAYRSSN